MAENVKNALSGLKDLALTGAKNLGGDAAGFLATGAPPAAGKLEQSLNGGLQNLLKTVAPTPSVSEVLALAKRG